MKKRRIKLHLYVLELGWGGAMWLFQRPTHYKFYILVYDSISFFNQSIHVKLISYEMFAWELDLW